MDIGCHPKQEYQVSHYEPRVHKPPEVVGQEVGEVASLDVAIDGGEGEGSEHHKDGRWLAFDAKGKNENSGEKSIVNSDKCYNSFLI